MDGCGCLGQLGPVGDQGVVGRRLLCILPLVGADVVEAVCEILYGLGLANDLLQQHRGVMRDAVPLMRLDEVLEAFPHRQVAITFRFPILVEFVARQDAHLTR